MKMEYQIIIILLYNQTNHLSQFCRKNCDKINDEPGGTYITNSHISIFDYSDGYILVKGD